jgi:hypothetical protein
MGHHFVPQAHLRRFECSDGPGMVWMYDKQGRIFSRVPIKCSAQSPEYYHPEVEAGLAEDIEGPANSAIEKIRRQDLLNNTERTCVSMYLLTMATRGPRQRRKSFEEIAPKAFESTFREMEVGIQAWIRHSGGNPEAHAQMRELERVRDKFSKAPPQHIVDLIRTPFWSERTVECVHNMIWRIAPAPTPLFYFTCDTPTHLSEWAGVGTPESELTFPISKELALIGSHTGPPASIEFLQPQADLVAEINRRMVNCAERFVFSHTKEDWIAEWADNPPPFNRIQWLANPDVNS